MLKICQFLGGSHVPNKKDGTEMRHTYTSVKQKN